MVKERTAPVPSSRIAPIRNLQRWRQVQAILLRYGFDLLIEQNEIKEVRRFLKDKLRLSLGEFDDRSVPERVRLMLQELGPTYVKLGQMLSSRRELLPADWVAELSKLQDEVEPFPAEQVRAVVTQELGAPPEELFDTFEMEPIAAASIGQVHQARLHDRRPVVVKVQRPHIAPQIQSDVEIIREIARLLEKRTQFGRQYGVVGIVDEFARTLEEELDYRNEGRNAERLRQNMAEIPEVHVPFIYWELVTPRVLTLERVPGIKVSHLEDLIQAGVERKALADVFMRSMFQQILLDGFFHADPHPGNLFVEPETGSLIFLDLGMMGRLLEEQRHDLSDLILGLKQRDSREVTRVAMSIGSPFQPVDEMSLRRDLDRLLDRYLTASLAEIAFATMLREIVACLFEHGIRLPHALTMGIKALIQAEEIARTLDPDVQIIEIAERLSQELLWERLSPEALLTNLIADAREFGRLTRKLPRALEQLLQQLQSGKLMIGLDLPGLPEQVEHFHAIANRLTAGIVVAGMVVGSAIAMNVSPNVSWRFIPVLGTISFALSMVAGTILIGQALLDLWRTRHKR